MLEGLDHVPRNTADVYAEEVDIMEKKKVLENVKGAFQEGARSFRDHPEAEDPGGHFGLSILPPKMGEGGRAAVSRTLLCFTF